MKWVSLAIVSIAVLAGAYGLYWFSLGAEPANSKQQQSAPNTLEAAISQMQMSPASGHEGEVYLVRIYADDQEVGRVISLSGDFAPFTDTRTGRRVTFSGTQYASYDQALASFDQ